MLLSSFKKHKNIREIENHPTSKISSAAQGVVEMQGFAWPKDETIVHYQAQELLYYRCTVEKKVTRGSGKSRRTTWESVFTTQKHMKTLLIDATGAVEISFNGFASPQNQKKGLFSLFTNLISGRFNTVSSAAQFSSGSDKRGWTAISSEEQMYLLGHVITSSIQSFPPSKGMLGLFSQSFRIIEEKVPVGAPLYIKGSYSSIQPPSPIETSLGLFNFSRMVFDPARTLKDLKQILDKNSDSKVSESELFAGYAKLASMSRRLPSKIEEKIFHKIHGHVMDSASEQMLLYFSHQEHIIKKLRRQFFSHVAIGLVLVAFGLSSLVGDDAEKIFEFLKRDNKPTGQIARHVQSTNELNVRILHEQCVAQEIKSCLLLLNSEVTLSLPAENAKYYKLQACRLGDSSFCVEH